MQLDIFLEIVALYRQKIADLEQKLANALADDIADDEAIELAKRQAEDSTARAVSAEQLLEEYRNQDIAEDNQLLDTMNSVLSELRQFEDVGSI
ncbi:hypothetical protein ACE1AT_11455 [Pelatocladus sp. BLCC-F211]|uniref:hypothetical protein n=1 Tax=Pelatocladus sp. BLCC-F211 TaxID=3342752 RepID=UPI0035B87A01